MKFEQDFALYDHGSIIRLQPNSDAAKEWVAEYLPADAMTFGRGIVIEPRYIGPILQGIMDADLSVLGVPGA